MEKPRTVLRCNLPHQASAGNGSVRVVLWISAVQVNTKSSPCDEWQRPGISNAGEVKGGHYLLNFLSFLNIFAFLLQHLLNIMKSIFNFIYFSTHCIWRWTFQDFSANLLQQDKDTFGLEMFSAFYSQVQMIKGVVILLHAFTYKKSFKGSRKNSKPYWLMS